MFERLRQEYDDLQYEKDRREDILSPTHEELEYSYGLLEDIYNYYLNNLETPLEEEWV